MTFRCRVAVLILLALADSATAQDATIRVDAGKATGRVGPLPRRRLHRGRQPRDLRRPLQPDDLRRELSGAVGAVAAQGLPRLRRQLGVEGRRTARRRRRGAEAGQRPAGVRRRARSASRSSSPTAKAGNAGLIVKRRQARRRGRQLRRLRGLARPRAQRAALGRHRHNWEPIKDMPCDVPTGEWVRAGGEVDRARAWKSSVDGKSVLTYEDRDIRCRPAPSACGSGSARPATATCGSRRAASDETALRAATRASGGGQRHVGAARRGTARASFRLGDRPALSSARRARRSPLPRARARSASRTAA